MPSDTRSAASADNSVLKGLHKFEKDGFGHVPIFHGQNALRLHHRSSALGAPSHFTVPLHEVLLAAGVVHCRDLRRHHGYPAHAQGAERGDISGSRTTKSKSCSRGEDANRCTPTRCGQGY